MTIKAIDSWTAAGDGSPGSEAAANEAVLHLLQDAVGAHSQYPTEPNKNYHQQLPSITVELIFGCWMRDSLERQLKT